MREKKQSSLISSFVLKEREKIKKTQNFGKNSEFYFVK